MTPDQFASALAEFAPDDTKVVTTTTSDRVVFSAIPRSKDSDSMPERQYAVRFPENSTEIPDDAMNFALLELFPERKLTAAEEKSKERVAEKIEAASKKTGARFKREIK